MPLSSRRSLSSILAVDLGGGYSLPSCDSNSQEPLNRKLGAGSSRGAVAQLGERLHGMQEVVGSIPSGSIEFDPSWRSAETGRSLPVVKKIDSESSSGSSDEGAFFGLKRR